MPTINLVNFAGIGLWNSFAKLEINGKVDAMRQGLLTASLILIAAHAASAYAQSSVGPALVRPAPIPDTGAVVGELTAAAPRTPDGKPYDCYSIDTTAGSRWTVTMSSAALDSALQIARGALCSAASLQHQNDNVSPEGKDAQVSFTAVGGRYLILARSNTADGAGPYQLSALSSGGQQTAGGSATSPVVDRRALMEQQVEVRRAQVAADEAAKRAAQAAYQAQVDAAAAEQRRKARERSQAFNAFLGAAVTVMGEVNTQLAAENARQASIAAAQTAQLVQQAAAQRQAQANAQAAQAQRAQAAQSGRIATQGSGTTTSQSTAGLYTTTPQGRFMDHDAAIRAAIAAQRGGGVPGAVGQPQLNALEQQRIAAANQQARLAQIQASEAARVQQERLAMARTAAGNFDRGPASSSSGQQATLTNGGAAASPMPSPPSGGMSTVGLRPFRPDGDPGEGRLSRPGVAIGRCQASSASVNYSMDSFMGGGKVAAALAWQGDANCQPPGDATIWLRVQDGTAYGYARVDGVLPRAGAVGSDMARIHDWDEMFCSFNGNSPGQCMDAASAKQLWTNGRVTGFEVTWGG
ncbi:PPC domain-containing protein [Caulobacter henricii]|uniref:Uncharacterized protein n=1 Tax=Caulobacter henricii TaxID=69395 RepID=A0A0P0P2X2_9CAUL|nr:PPC domain-containing protein [Caulobacter henricii]ALL14910.1 hypothetical protein AQ619_16910 [Caulobacter henricii]